MDQGTLAQIRSNANGFAPGTTARACLHHAANEVEALTTTLKEIRPALVGRSVVIAAQESPDEYELAEVEQAIMLIDAALTRTSPAERR